MSSANPVPWPLLLDQLLDEIARRAAHIVLAQLDQPAPAAVSPFMTIAEAAEYARCKRQRIDDLLSARRLTRFKDGRRTLVSRAELDQYLAATTGPNKDSISTEHRATVTNADNKKPV